ncbi:unnamed protein product, partial [Ectocarpus sp. 6 AP-2014]
MRARGRHGRGMPSGSMSRLDKKTQEGSRRGEPRRFSPGFDSAGFYWRHKMWHQRMALYFGTMPAVIQQLGQTPKKLRMSVSVLALTGVAGGGNHQWCTRRNGRGRV